MRSCGGRAWITNSNPVGTLSGPSRNSFWTSSGPSLRFPHGICVAATISMRRLTVMLVLCLIGTAEFACSRRSARTVRLPTASDLNQRAARERGSARETGRPIESLKNTFSGSPESRAAGENTDVVSQAGDASSPSSGVGTSGAVSVETRYPSAQSGHTPQPPARGRVLSRAGDAVRGVGGAASAWVIVLCGLAAGLIVALLMRRAHDSA
jgi:hypothetical protein